MPLKKSNPGGQYRLLMENWISDTESVYSNALQWKSTGQCLALE